jgi:hypothetical protein
MTAINPAKLKVQADELGTLLKKPELFIPALHDLLTFYSARVRQTSLAQTPLTLQSYQTPSPVLRVLEIEFKERIQDDPELGKNVCDSLWEEHWVEFRQLAIFSLGSLPPEDPESILDRVTAWLEDCTAENIRRLLMTNGLRSLAEEKPEICLSYFEQLVASGTKANHQAALFGLEPFVKNQEFLNLPLVYKILGRVLLTEESGLVKEITALLRLLIQRSEQETVYFLKRQLKEAAQPRISRISRQLLDKFSPENRRLIKNHLGKI